MRSVPCLATGVILLVVLSGAPRAQTTGDSAPIPSGAGASPGGPRPGEELPKPGGGTFLSDGHRNGHATKVYLQEIRSGRLVDVHGLDAGGAIDPAPRFRDFLIGETIQESPGDYLLYTSPSTHVAHLVVLRTPGAPEPAPGAGTFADLVRRAEQAALLVPPRPAGAPLVASLPRNGALGLHFSDLLADDAAAAIALLQNVRVQVGSALDVPFAARVAFDSNHGGIAGGSFHSTRVLIDATTSSFEAGETPTPLPVNELGLPPSTSLTGASVLFRLPTLLDPGTGQLTRLENLAGHGLARDDNGPIDPARPGIQVDLVRAARVANDSEANSGFLLDLEPPRVLGEFAVALTQAQPDPTGTPGFAFLVDWTFQGPCVGRPRLGDALETPAGTLELVENGPAPDPSGSVQNVRVRLAQGAPTTAAALPGLVSFVARLRESQAESACWFRILPEATLPPGTGVSTTAQFGLRFSEPIRRDSIDPYDRFRLVLGPATEAADATNTVVAQLQASPDLSSYFLQPVLPLAHVQGTATLYHIELLSGAGGPTDLAGNPLHAGPSGELRVDRTEATQTSAGLVLRFAGTDEMPGLGTDLRGAIFHDLTAGTIRGRPATTFSAVADRINPVPSIMIPLSAGVQSPLSPLGSKLHSVWRYCDFGWSVHDETKYDVDVVGLAWAPRGGLVFNEFYPEFEIRLAHSSHLPDEAVDSNLLPRYPNSGLVAGPHLFDEDILQDPLSPQKVVHPRALGYTVNSSDLFVSAGGTQMLPYPLNRGPNAPQTYTWRDTSVLAQGGEHGAGVPLDIEVGPPLFLEPQVGSVAGAGEVPSIGLPLLLEFRCFPSDFGLGLNALDASLALNSSAQPNFRSYSTGGINSAGIPVVRPPDLELSPRGGFNPASTPPGLPTQFTADDVFYIGQVDLVYRVSRAHSAWFDTGSSSPGYAALLLELDPLANGSSAGVVAEVRGAGGFSGTAGAENDASQLDAYGELASGTVAFWNGDDTWHGPLSDINGARFVQLRLTFTNDIESGETPTLGSLALAFLR